MSRPSLAGKPLKHSVLTKMFELAPLFGFHEFTYYTRRGGAESLFTSVTHGQYTICNVYIQSTPPNVLFHATCFRAERPGSQLQYVDICLHCQQGQLKNKTEVTEKKILIPILKHQK